MSNVGLAVVIGIPAPDGVNSGIWSLVKVTCSTTPAAWCAALRENAVNLCLGPAHETGSLSLGCSSGEAEAASIGQGDCVLPLT